MENKTRMIYNGYVACFVAIGAAIAGLDFQVLHCCEDLQTSCKKLVEKTKMHKILASSLCKIGDSYNVLPALDKLMAFVSSLSSDVSGIHNNMPLTHSECYLITRLNRLLQLLDKRLKASYTFISSPIIESCTESHLAMVKNYYKIVNGMKETVANLFKIFKDSEENMWMIAQIKYISDCVHHLEFQRRVLVVFEGEVPNVLTCILSIASFVSSLMNHVLKSDFYKENISMCYAFLTILHKHLLKARDIITHSSEEKVLVRKCGNTKLAANFLTKMVDGVWADKTEPISVLRKMKVSVKKCGNTKLAANFLTKMVEGVWADKNCRNTHSVASNFLKKMLEGDKKVWNHVYRPKKEGEWNIVSTTNIKEDGEWDFIL